MCHAPRNAVAVPRTVFPAHAKLQWHRVQHGEVVAVTRWRVMQQALCCALPSLPDCGPFPPPQWHSETCLSLLGMPTLLALLMLLLLLLLWIVVLREHGDNEVVMVRCWARERAALCSRFCQRRASDLLKLLLRDVSMETCEGAGACARTSWCVRCVRAPPPALPAAGATCFADIQLRLPLAPG